MGNMKAVIFCVHPQSRGFKIKRHIRCPLPRFGGGAPKNDHLYNNKNNKNNENNKSNKTHDECRNFLKQIESLEADGKS